MKVSSTVLRRLFQLTTFSLFSVVVNAKGPAYYPDVSSILDRKCVYCHRPEGNARFINLSTYESVRNAAKMIGSSLKNGTMPPWSADPSQHYQNELPLTVTEKKVLMDWTKSSSFPRGEASSVGSPKNIWWRQRLEGLEDADVKLTAATAFTPPAKANHVQCFIFDWPYKDERFITALYYKHAAPWQVHHSVLLAVDKDGSPKLQRRLQNATGGSFECGREPVYDDLTAAFGGPAGNLPDGTGLYVPQNSRLLLEVHYNTFASEAPERDKPQILVKTKTHIDHVGQLLVWQPKEEQLRVPANGKLSLKYRSSPQDFLAQRQARFFSKSTPLKVHFMTMHMHDVGVSTSLTVEGKKSSKLLVRIPQWQSMMQVYDFILQKPVAIEPGDELQLTCDYDNTESNLRRPLLDGQSVPITWGWRWDQEMCMGFIFVSAS